MSSHHPINMNALVIRACADALETNPNSPSVILSTIVHALKLVAVADDGAVTRDGRTTSAGLSVHAPVLGTAPTHVPIVGLDAAVRTQVVLHDDPATGTTKLHFWHAPDVMPPHDHPWSGEFDDFGPVQIAFVATILRGGYLEERYTPRTTILHDGVCAVPDVVYERSERRYGRGEINVMPYGVFHKLLEVEPGTVTLMQTAPRTADGRWFFFDPVTGQKRDPDKDPAFIGALRAINPHLMPR
jgi:hypothetical protein